MELTWLDFLENYEKEDVSLIRKAISNKKDNMKTVVEAAFSTHPYVTKQEAKLTIESEFTDPKKVPAGIDLDWVVANKNAIISKIDLMTEHEIKIVINAQDKGSAPSVSSVVNPGTSTANSGSAVVVGEPIAFDMETEGKKRGRGRPRKNPLPLPSQDKEELSEEEEMVKKLSEMGYVVTKKVDECDVPKKLRESAFNITEDEDDEEGYSDEDDDNSDGLDISWEDIMDKLEDGDDGKDEDEDERDGTSDEEYAEDDGLGTPGELADQRQKESEFRGTPPQSVRHEEGVDDEGDEPIEEAGEPLSDEEKDELKKIDSKNPKFAEYLKSLRDRTRSGVTTKMSDMNDMMRDATK